MNKLQIKIGEKEFTAKLGLAFLEKVTKGEGMDIVGVVAKIESEPLFFIPRLIFHAIEQGGGKCTLEQIYDWLDEVGIGCAEVVKFSELFVKSLQVHFPQDMKEVGKPKVAKKQT